MSKPAPETVKSSWRVTLEVLSTESHPIAPEGEKRAGGRLRLPGPRSVDVMLQGVWAIRKVRLAAIKVGSRVVDIKVRGRGNAELGGADEREVHGQKGVGDWGSGCRHG